MARNGGEVVTKKNSKLEAFLKRNLDADSVERIRATESCIVCSEKEDKAFKFVILSDEWIYLTENPPKKIQEAVHLRDIVSVDLANDFPEFLSGEERDNTQHIVIKYLTDDETKGRKKRVNSKRLASKTLRTPKSSRALSARGSLSVSGRMTPLGSSRNTFASLSARDLSSKDRKVQFASENLSPNIQRKTASLKEPTSSVLTSQNDVTRSRSVSEDLWKEVTESPRNKSARSAPKQSSNPRANTNRNNSEELTLSSDQHLTNNSASTLLSRYSGSNYLQVQSCPRQLPNRSGEQTSAKKVIKKSGTRGSGGYCSDDSADSGDEYDNTQRRLTAASLGIPRLNLETPADDSGKDAEIIPSNLDFISSFDLLPNPDLRRPRSHSIGVVENISSRHDMSGDENDDDDDDDEEDKEEDEMCLREGVLHLYILSYSSPMLMLTRCAWNNFILRGTLQEDPELAVKMCNFSQKGPGTSEKLERLFSQLKSELLVPSNSLETKFSLISELKTAAQRNFTLKRLFWKTSEMLTYLVRILHDYLPQSRNPFVTGTDNEEAKQARADEFDLVIEIISTIGIMLRETEILPGRLKILKASKGKSMQDLLSLLTCFPEVPQKYIPPSSKAQKLLRSAHSDQWQCTADIELSKLVAELTTVSSSVLYELVLIAQQANWGDAEGSFLNIAWMVKSLEGLNCMEKFVESVIGQAMRLVSPSRSDELTPYEMVIAHQQFSLLLNFLDYSPSLANYIRSNFYEEFKYYIQPPIIKRKFTQRYLIQPHTLRIIEKVVSAILQKKVTYHKT